MRAVLLLMVVAGLAYPQDQQAPNLTIRTDTQLVLASFHVVQKNKYALDLEAADFELLEDGKRREIAVFEPPETEAVSRAVPLEVILLLDVSLSVMNWNLLDNYSVQETIVASLGENAGVSIYGFAGKIRKFTKGPTRQAAEIEAALKNAYAFASGGTRLYEAIVGTARNASENGGARVMVVLSDGLPTSDFSFKEAVTVARQLGIPIYPVVLGHDRNAVRNPNKEIAGSNQERQRIPNTTEMRRMNTMGQQSSAPGRGDRQQAKAGPGGGGRQSKAMMRESRMAEFASLGKATGGRSFDPKDVNNAVMREILKSVANEVRTSYTVGYYSSGDGGEKRERKVKVKLTKKKAGKLRGGERLVVY